MGTDIKHPVSDRQSWASECPDVKNYKWRLNPVRHRMLYSCTQMATVGVKGLTTQVVSKCFTSLVAGCYLVTGTRRSDHITPVLRQLHWLPVRQRVDFKVPTLVHRSLSGISPSNLADDCRLVADARERRLSSTVSRTALWRGHTAPSAIEHL